MVFPWFRSDPFQISRSCFTFLNEAQRQKDGQKGCDDDDPENGGNQTWFFGP